MRSKSEELDLVQWWFPKLVVEKPFAVLGGVVLVASVVVAIAGYNGDTALTDETAYDWIITDHESSERSEWNSNH